MIGGMIGGYDKMTLCNYGATPGNSDKVQTPNQMENGVRNYDLDFVGLASGHPLRLHIMSIPYNIVQCM